MWRNCLLHLHPRSAVAPGHASTDARSLLASHFAVLFFFAALATAGLRAESVPVELTQTLAHFSTEGPKGWSFTQTTESAGESLVEYFDAAKFEPNRWTLIRKNGRTPTAEEIAEYNQGKAMGMAGFTAPRLQDQFDPASAVLVRRDAERDVWRFQLKSGGADDKTSHFMAVTVTFYLPTRTIERVEIASTEPFSPVLGVKILEARTVMTYSLPSKDGPSLLQQATMHVRGRAFWFKSLDQDMNVTFSGHIWAGKK